MKKMMRIRRLYPDIFDYFPESHRESNICKVESNCQLQAYARYFGKQSILILPNMSDEPLTVKAVLPLDELGFTSTDSIKVSELLQENDVFAKGREIQVTVPAQDMAVVLVESC